MYKIIFSSFVFFALVLSLKSQVLMQEAESSVFDSLIVMQDENASAGQFLRMEKSGSLKWISFIEKEDWYNLKIQYRAFGGEKEEYLVVNSKQIPVGFGIAEQWTVFHKNIYLEKGETTLELKPSWGYLDIDYLSLEEPSLKYALTPQKNNYYLNHPRDLIIKLDNFKSAVTAVTIDNKSLKFEQNDYPFEEKAAKLVLAKENFTDLAAGSYEVLVILENGIRLKQNLKIQKQYKSVGLTIIAPYVEHGSAVIFILPDKSTMLVDCAKAQYRDQTLIPLMNQIGIDTLDHFFITHYHGDHDSGDRGEKIKQLFCVKDFYDYQSFNSGDTFKKGGVNFKILNSYAEGNDENTRSLSFKMEYNGFVFVHGGDTYGVNQVKILERFPDDVAADVFYANHHFHGSVNVPYLRTMQPDAVIIQAQEAIYARSAYWEKYLLETRDYLLKTKNHFIENIVTLELGTVIFRINNKNDWTYDTQYNNNFLQLINK